MKRCSKCRVEKNLEEFHNSRATTDGKQNYCKSCAVSYRESQNKGSVYSKRHYAKNRQKRIDAQIKRKRQRKRILVEEHGGQCKICGYSRSYRAMHFHHLDPSLKEFGLGAVSRGIERLRAEASKCLMVCSNCHCEIEDGLVPVAAVEQIIDVEFAAPD